MTLAPEHWLLLFAEAIAFMINGVPAPEANEGKAQ